MTAGKTFDLGRLDFLFHPRSVALIGASATPGKWGLFILHNILKDGYRGKVHAVGRKGASVLGTVFHGSIDEIDGEIDLALVAVPPASVLPEVERCIRKGVGAVYIVTGGFGETGSQEGRAAEENLLELSRGSGVPIVGPNGQGIVNTHLDLCAQMFFTMPPKGRISLATQSGNIGVVLSNFSYMSGIGMSKIVSTGNAACADLADFVEYLGGDGETGVACIYVEGTREGRGLIEAIASVSKRKPVIVMKSGNTRPGSRAAASHSAAMASDARIFTDACRNAGALVVESLEEMWDAACMLCSQPPLQGRNIGILTLGGGLGVITADLASEAGFEVAPLPGRLKASLDELLPPRWSGGNPIDLAASEGPTTVADVLGRMADLGGFDAIVFVGFGENGLARHMIETGRFGRTSPIREMCEALKGIEAGIHQVVLKILRGKKIPFAGIAEAAAMAREISDSSITAHAGEGYVTFPTPERGIRALRHLLDHSALRRENR
jgi:acyl-CoA synthetase (NDP forming)